jgi:hypothetical protein
MIERLEIDRVTNRKNLTCCNLTLISIPSPHFLAPQQGDESSGEHLLALLEKQLYDVPYQK